MIILFITVEADVSIGLHKTNGSEDEQEVYGA